MMGGLCRFGWTARNSGITFGGHVIARVGPEGGKARSIQVPTNAGNIGWEPSIDGIIVGCGHCSTIVSLDH